MVFRNGAPPFLPLGSRVGKDLGVGHGRWHGAWGPGMDVIGHWPPRSCPPWWVMVPATQQQVSQMGVVGKLEAVYTKLQTVDTSNFQKWVDKVNSTGCLGPHHQICVGKKRISPKSKFWVSAIESEYLAVTN